MNLSKFIPYKKLGSKEIGFFFPQANHKIYFPYVSKTLDKLNFENDFDQKIFLSILEGAGNIIYQAYNNGEYLEPLFPYKINCRRNEANVLSKKQPADLYTKHFFGDIFNYPYIFEKQLKHSNSVNFYKNLYTLGLTIYYLYTGNLPLDHKKLSLGFMNSKFINYLIKSFVQEDLSLINKNAIYDCILSITGDYMIFNMEDIDINIKTDNIDRAYFEYSDGSVLFGKMLFRLNNVIALDQIDIFCYLVSQGMFNIKFDSQICQDFDFDFMIQYYLETEPYMQLFMICERQPSISFGAFDVRDRISIISPCDILFPYYFGNAIEKYYNITEKDEVLETLIDYIASYDPYTKTSLILQFVNFANVFPFRDRFDPNDIALMIFEFAETPMIDPDRFGDIASLVYSVPLSNRPNGLHTVIEILMDSFFVLVNDATVIKKDMWQFIYDYQRDFFAADFNDMRLHIVTDKSQIKNEILKLSLSELRNMPRGKLVQHANYVGLPNKPGPVLMDDLELAKAYSRFIY